MTDALYRDALVKCADRYIDMILQQEHPDGTLLEFAFELRHRSNGKRIEPFFHEDSEPYPLLKLNRWLGYIQGVLIERGITDVTTERDWTRPLFRPIDFG